jgi:SAM-dependent methyltransferase
MSDLRTTTTTADFDYESKRWGVGPVRPRPWYMNGLKLRYLLDDLSASGSVLDVGCGGGSVAKAVKRERPALDVHGCDLSASAIAAACSSDPQGVDFRVATAERLPYHDATMDFVWIFDVLEHVEDPEQVLREVARVLKPGGGFHIVLPLEAQPRTLYKLIGCGSRWTAKVRHGGHIQIFSADTFGELATSCGFRVKRTRWSYHALLQVLDVAYFSWLDRRGPVSGSVEDMSSHRRGPSGAIMRAATKTVAAAAWTEARVLRGLPGGCGHFTCVKAK